MEYEFKHALDMLTPFLPLVPADVKRRCMDHFSRVTGQYATGEITAEEFREQIRLSQSQLRREMRKTAARGAEDLPGAGTVVTPRRSRVRGAQRQGLPAWMREQRSRFGTN